MSDTWHSRYEKGLPQYYKDRIPQVQRIPSSSPSFHGASQVITRYVLRHIHLLLTLVLLDRQPRISRDKVLNP